MAPCGGNAPRQHLLACVLAIRTRSNSVRAGEMTAWRQPVVDVVRDYEHMHAIVLANAKGGVGKTTLVAQLAGLLAAAGHRVLAIDLDPQGNLSRDLGYAAHADDG